MGRREEAEQALAAVKALNVKDPYEAGIASAYFALGDKERGFERLKRAALQPQSWSPFNPRL
jgi:hypothetical protein